MVVADKTVLLWTGQAPDGGGVLQEQVWTAGKLLPFHVLSSRPVRLPCVSHRPGVQPGLVTGVGRGQGSGSGRVVSLRRTC